MKRTRTLPIVWAVTVLAQCMPALARSGDIADVLSQPKRLPPPTWVRDGLRLTYALGEYTGSGAGCRSVLSHSCLPPAAGRHGYFQADVVSIDRDVVLLDARSWHYRGRGKALVLTDRAGQVGLPGCGANLWVNPDALRNLPAKPKPPWKITRTPCKIGQTTYQAVRFDYRKDATHHAWIFDTNNGILLAAATSTPAGTGGRVKTTSFTLVGRRQLDLPWTRHSETPRWLLYGESLRYRGKQALGMDCRTRHTSTPPPRPLEARFTVTRRYGSVVVCDLVVAPTSGTDMTTHRRTFVSGITQIHPLCLPPDALSRLKSGQVIDTDDITKMKTTVHYVGKDANGDPIVTIRTAGPACRIDCSYDTETGRALAMKQVNLLHGFATAEVTYTLVGSKIRIPLHEVVPIHGCPRPLRWFLRR